MGWDENAVAEIHQRYKFGGMVMDLTDRRDSFIKDEFDETRRVLRRTTRQLIWIQFAFAVLNVLTFAVLLKWLR